MSLRKAIILTVGILAIYGVFSVAYIARVPWMKFRTAFNKTVYSVNVSEGITQWDKISNTIQGNFWIMPIVIAIVITVGVYMIMQEREYVTTQRTGRGAFG